MFFHEPINTRFQPGWEIILGRIKILEREEGYIRGELHASSFSQGRGEVRGWMYLMNRDFRSTLELPSPEDNGVLLSIEIYHCKSQLTPVVEGEEVGVEVQVKGQRRFRTMKIQKFWKKRSPLPVP